MACLATLLHHSLIARMDDGEPSDGQLEPCLTTRLVTRFSYQPHGQQAFGNVRGDRRGLALRSAGKGV